MTSPIVVYDFHGSAGASSTVEEMSSRTETRGVRLNIPNGPHVTVSATRKDGGAWSEPAAQVPQANISYGQWQDLVKTVEKGFAEYSARFEDAHPEVDGPKKKRKTEEKPFAVPQSTLSQCPFCGSVGTHYPWCRL